MSRARWIGLALGFALIYPSVMTWLYFVELAVEGQGPNPTFQVVYNAGKILQFSFPLLCALVFDGRLPRPTWPTRKGMWAGLLFGLAIACTTCLLYALLSHYTSLFAETPDRLRSKVEQFGMASPAGFLLLAGFLSVIHSLLEEYYWRWFVFGWLRKRISFPLAVLLSSLGFMGHHVIVLWVYFPTRLWDAVVPFSLCIAVGGAVWAWLYDRSGSLYPSWLSHFLVDAGIMLVGYEMLFVGRIGH